ncbi:13481_t:CDS:1, partial [Cetraspora pellucida]
QPVSSIIFTQTKDSTENLITLNISYNFWYMNNIDQNIHRASI